MAKIRWGWVVLSFIFGLWPVGVVLIILKILGDQAEDELKRIRVQQAKRTAWTADTISDTNLDQTFQDVKTRPVKEKNADGATQWSGSTYRSRRKKMAATQGGSDVYYAKNECLRLLNPKRGKGLQILGGILLALACFSGTMFLLDGLVEGHLLVRLMGMVSTGFVFGLPGLAMLVAGTNKRKRNARCRNHLAMISTRRTVSLDELDLASPGNYKTVCKDLEWMLGQGFFPGAYLDMGRRVLTYPGEQVAQQAMRSHATIDGKGRKVYQEEKRIRDLDAQIEDGYVSQRIQRLARLTHQIFTYVEENPEKEPKIRQFRNHYLPKTIGILEAYARMERQNVSGTNIRGAMEDVEQIMDKLVAGFEKQLDALFDSEAMDVTTDINVLENLMNLEGLGDLDPFGATTQAYQNHTR